MGGGGRIGERESTEREGRAHNVMNMWTDTQYMNIITSLSHIHFFFEAALLYTV